MPKENYSTGRYQLVNTHDEKFMVYATKQKARFLFKNYSRLGFKSVQLLEYMNKLDFPNWDSRVLK